LHVALPSWNEQINSNSILRRRFNFALDTKSLLYISFFASGISAIIYQLVWQRDLFRLFGVNIESVTAVITAFMVGLGCGGLLGSWLSRRQSTSPLLVFALMEATIAGLGLASLRVFEWIGSLVGSSPLSIRTLATIAVLLVPTCCMGATLPLLVGHAVRKSVNVGVSTGRLYYVNTLGAAIGCILAAICVFPFLGLTAALRIAASMNIVACCGAGIAYMQARTDEELERVLESPITRTLPSPREGQSVAYPMAMILAGFSGFVSLSYEIFFLHVASFASGGNSVALTLVLGAILLGIASGAREASDRAKISGAKSTGFIGALTWASVIGLIVLPIMTHSDIVKTSLVFALLPMAILIAKGLGEVFPLLAHLAIPPDGKTGFRVGLVYTMNIVGSALGTLLTGFVLSQSLGLRGLAALLATFTLCLALLLAVSSGPLRRRPSTLVAAGLLSALVLMGLQEKLTTHLFESMLAGVDPTYAGKATDVIENRSGIVVVNEHGTVYGGGVYDGAFNIDPYRDVNGVIRPYSLSLFHANPKKVLMIGLASGSWAQVIANNPYVSHFTVIEIDPAYLSLIRRTPIVESLLMNPKVTVILDDGHRWLQAHPGEKFDAILSNTTYHFRTNTSNLLSVEFNRLIQRHLNPGGVYLFNATGSIRAQRTGCLSFKFGFRVLNNVMVSDSPFDLDVARWRRVLAAYAIDGKRMFPTDSPAQAESFDHFVAMPSESDDKAIVPADRRMERCESILRRTPELPLITDDNMGTEWRYPLLRRE
jgi:predicted membrane-bound spermidine synthase